MGKKKNPVIAVRQSDLKRIKNEITTQAINDAFSLFLMTLCDKWGFGHKRLNRLYNDINAQAKLVDDGYVSISTFKKILDDDYGITIK